MLNHSPQTRAREEVVLYKVCAPKGNELTPRFQRWVPTKQKRALKVAREPPPLFELRRVRKAGKGRAIAKRRRMKRRAALISIRYGAPDSGAPSGHIALNCLTQG